MMTFVEPLSNREYPCFVWGKDVCVHKLGEELKISAAEICTQEERDSVPDALRLYRQAVSRFGSQKRQGKNSPHVQFANAEDDQKLIEFVRRFGPVVVSSLRREDRPDPSEYWADIGLTQSYVVARENLAELRAERLVYRAALELLSELQDQREPKIVVIRTLVSEIVDNVSRWPKQWERERAFRASGQGYSLQLTWSFSQQNIEHLQIYRYYVNRESSGDRFKDGLIAIDPIDAAHHVICELVNAFSPVVYTWGKKPVEAPDIDLTGGIRPILYYILRREYLRGGGIGICRNIECRHLFEIERSGQEFCSDLCSRHQRQRDYWQHRGKKLRQRRRKRKK